MFEPVSSSFFTIFCLTPSSSRLNSCVSLPLNISRAIWRVSSSCSGRGVMRLPIPKRAAAPIPGTIFLSTRPRFSRNFGVFQGFGGSKICGFGDKKLSEKIRERFASIPGTKSRRWSLVSLARIFVAEHSKGARDIFGGRRNFYPWHQIKEVFEIIPGTPKTTKSRSRSPLSLAPVGWHLWH